MNAFEHRTPAVPQAVSGPENPFSSRRIRPGALPYLFRDGEDAETLVGRLGHNGWRGEIVGPHGSGKSALLAALVPAIEHSGRQPLVVELHDGQRRLPIDLEQESRARPFSILIVDGYEQLGRLQRFSLQRLCRRRGWGLLVTAHDSVGLPELCRTAADVDLFRKIVERLTVGSPCPLQDSELVERFARHGGDLREALFDLYDLYEQRRPSPTQDLT